MILLYKNKSDIQNCNNYRGINLQRHTKKVWEKIDDKEWCVYRQDQLSFIQEHVTTKVKHLVVEIL